MKHKLVRRVIASVMTALLVVGLIPMTFTGGGVKVSAADGKYVFDATTLTASADKEEIGDGTTAGDDNYFKIVGKVIKRTNSDGSVKAAEIEKFSKSAVEFTVTGTATAVVKMSSTGGSNTSWVALVNTADGSVVANKEAVSKVTGTSATTLTYEGLKAGTYRVVSNGTDENDEEQKRGARLFSIEVDEQIPVVTTDYGFDATTLTASADKEEIGDGVTVGTDNYFKIIGRL